MRAHRIVVALLAVAAIVGAARPAAAQLYGASPFQNAFYRLDMITGGAASTATVTLDIGNTVTGVNSVTIDPTTDIAYALVKALGISGRLLATIDLTTAVAVVVGNLGDNFSSLAFRADGQLFGVTGDGATVPETLYQIDKSNGATTLATALGNGVDGEVIAYDPVDGFFYHWSGNGTVVFEKIESSPPYTVTNIPISGTTFGEIFGAVWDHCRGQFLVSNIGSSFQDWTVTGTSGAAFGSNPDDIRGMALVGPNSCDVDLTTTVVVTPPVPVIGNAVTATVTVLNHGPARALTPSVAVTVPPTMTGAVSSGCPEDPNGTTTCTLPTLFAGDSAQFTITGTYAGGGQDLVAVATTTSNETFPPDNTSSGTVPVELLGFTVE